MRAQTVFEGQLTSLRRGKDDVKEVGRGLECGLRVDGFTAWREVHVRHFSYPFPAADCNPLLVLSVSAVACDAEFVSILRTSKTYRIGNPPPPPPGNTHTSAHPSLISVTVGGFGSSKTPNFAKIMHELAWRVVSKPSQTVS